MRIPPQTPPGFRRKPNAGFDSQSRVHYGTQVILASGFVSGVSYHNPGGRIQERLKCAEQALRRGCGGGVLCAAT